MPDGLTGRFIACCRGDAGLALVVIVFVAVVGQVMLIGDGAVMRALVGMCVKFDHRHRPDHEHHQQRKRRQISARDAEPGSQAVAEGSKRHRVSMTHANDIVQAHDHGHS